MQKVPSNLIKYEVTFRSKLKKAETWTATYMAENFSHCEEQALDTLKSNKDENHYDIFRIEVW